MEEGDTILAPVSDMLYDNEAAREQRRDGKG